MAGVSKGIAFQMTPLPGVQGQEIDLVSLCLCRDGSTPTGWKEKPPSHKSGRFQLSAGLGIRQLARQGQDRALVHKSVKNEDRSWDVYENKDECDKIDNNKSGFLAEDAPISRKWMAIHRIFA